MNPAGYDVSVQVSVRGRDSRYGEHLSVSHSWTAGDGSMGAAFRVLAEISDRAAELAERAKQEPAT